MGEQIKKLFCAYSLRNIEKSPFSLKWLNHSNIQQRKIDLKIKTHWPGFWI